MYRQAFTYLRRDHVAFVGKTSSLNSTETFEMKFLNSKILPKGEKSIGDQYSTNDIDITTQKKRDEGHFKREDSIPPFFVHTC
jgi:hypothetical protein